MHKGVGPLHTKMRHLVGVRFYLPQKRKTTFAASSAQAKRGGLVRGQAKVVLSFLEWSNKIEPNRYSPGKRTPIQIDNFIFYVILNTERAPTPKRMLLMALNYPILWIRQGRHFYFFLITISCKNT